MNSPLIKNTQEKPSSADSITGSLPDTVTKSSRPPAAEYDRARRELRDRDLNPESRHDQNNSSDIDDGSSPIMRRVIKIYNPEIERHAEQLRSILRSSQKEDRKYSESQEAGGIKLS